MSARVFNDDTPELAGTPDYRCQACGMNVRKLVAFSGYGKDWQACFPCVKEAAEAIKESERA